MTSGIYDFAGTKISHNELNGTLCANDLMNAYKMKYPTTSKTIHKFLDTAAAKEYVDLLIHTEKIPLKQVLFSKKGSSGSTWMHPFLFLEFARWLSPEYSVSVIKTLQKVFTEMYPDEPLIEAISKHIAPHTHDAYTRELRMLESIAAASIDGIPYGEDEFVRRLAELKRHDVKLISSSVLTEKKRQQMLLSVSEFL